MRKVTLAVVIALIGTLLIGCSGNKKMLAQREQQISDLEEDLRQMDNKLAEEKIRADKLHADLQKALADLEKKEKLWLEKEKTLSKISMPDAVTFASGSTKLTQKGMEILDTVWSVLTQYPEHHIIIEGHTDNVQLTERLKTRFKSNWELSSGRAHAVLHYFITKHKADPARLSAVGFGEYQPIADNDTDEGKEKNRRVVIAVRTTV
jgi:chemotaxis protein MotB